MENQGYYVPSGNVAAPDITAVLSHSMTRVYLYMFLGLIVTTGAALIAASNLFFDKMIEHMEIFYILMITELLLVIILSAFARKMPFAASFVCFMMYSAVNGLTLSIVFLVYTAASIYSAFMVTGLTFGIMSVIGFITKKDLTTVGHYCIMGLIGLIIAGIVNIFIMNDLFSFAISAIGLLIFIGLTAYDTQKIKRWLEQETDEEAVKRIAIHGALVLYLDFINIFMKVLRIMGRRRR